ncbi:MAG: STAS domain-containing protein [Promicromonosporaceae bacterium]|nr:STAS domain-containing protein [Promicromonosporaceae bacterium]
MRDTSDPTSAIVSGTGTHDGLPELGDPASVHLIVGASRARIVLSGEIDADIGAELGEATAEAEATGLPVEIDAHHITFMDSSGVAFLARLASRMPHRVRILRAPPTVKFLLEVTRIGELLEIVDEDEGVD